MALALALCVSVVLGVSGTSVMVYTTQNYGASARSKADLKALALAEAGVNYAFSVLQAAPNPKDPNSVQRRSVALEDGEVTYFGVLTGSTWKLTGIGRVRNPSGPGTSDVVRTVSAGATLGSARRSAANNAVWNYIYTDELTGCTSLANSVVVDVPMYVRGNLCMTNSAQMSGFSLRVGGTVSLSQSASIGTATENIREAHIGGGCKLDNGALVSPCGAAQHVYADVSDTDKSGLTKPAVDLPYWYENAMPGPKHNCTSGSFPGGFDNDGVMNRSRPVVDLTPNFAYDCQVRDANGFLVGRIAWTPGAPGSLKILGTIFFDGDIEFRQLTELVYEGRATIYSSGKITIANRTIICGAVGCPDSWNPNQSLLALIAGASTEPIGFSIGNYSKFQGAIYVVNDFKDGNNTVTWGPIIARQIHLQNSTLNYYVPMETLAPGMPATYEETTTVTLVPGSWG